MSPACRLPFPSFPPTAAATTASLEAGPPKHCTYRLRAVVVHAGASAYSGHYFCFASIRGQWYNLNDSFVTRMDEASLESKLVGANAAYITFYERDGAGTGGDDGGDGGDEGDEGDGGDEGDEGEVQQVPSSASGNDGSDAAAAKSTVSRTATHDPGEGI